jgi:hypothetical protein
VATVIALDAELSSCNYKAPPIGRYAPIVSSCNALIEFSQRFMDARIRSSVRRSLLIESKTSLIEEIRPVTESRNRSAVGADRSSCCSNR